MSIESSEDNDALRNPEQLRGPMVVCICGPRAAGKDTILAELLEEFKDEGMRKIVGHTTREPRKGEKDGEAYHFVTKEALEEMERRGELFSKTTISGNLYAYAKTSIPPSGLHVTQTEPRFARMIRDEVARMGGKTLLVTIIATKDIRAARIQKRQNISDEGVRKMITDDPQKENLKEYWDFNVIARNHSNEISQPRQQVFDAVRKFVGQDPKPKRRSPMRKS